MFIYGKEEDSSLLDRAKLRAKRNGPYPLLHTNDRFDNRMTLPCGCDNCNAVITVSSESHIKKPLSEFKFRCPICEGYTYESTITYHLN